jgi:hypothetical protein
LKRYSLQAVSRIAQSEETSFTKFESRILRVAGARQKPRNGGAFTLIRTRESRGNARLTNLQKPVGHH